MHCHAFWTLYSTGRPWRTTPSHDGALLLLKVPQCAFYTPHLRIGLALGSTHRFFAATSASSQEPSISLPSALTSMCLYTIAISPKAVMALSPHEIQPCAEWVEQWISLLACWTDSFFARQSKLALLSHLRRYLDFIILRIGLHEGSLHVARLLTLCTFAIAYANQAGFPPVRVNCVSLSFEWLSAVTLFWVTDPLCVCDRPEDQPVQRVATGNCRRIQAWGEKVSVAEVRRRY